MEKLQEQYNQDLNMWNQTQLKEPSLFVVVMHDDQITTQDFVVQVLMDVFHFNSNQAQILMLHVHNQGQADIAEYVWDIAVSKIEQVSKIAKEQEFPLRCTLKKVEL